MERVGRGGVSSRRCDTRWVVAFKEAAEGRAIPQVTRPSSLIVESVPRPRERFRNECKAQQKGSRHYRPGQVRPTSTKETSTTSCEGAHVVGDCFYGRLCLLADIGQNAATSADGMSECTWLASLRGGRGVLLTRSGRTIWLASFVAAERAAAVRA